MKFGSVCSGIEAASVAWEPLGWRAAWFAEIEPFPCAVLAHHYPEVPNLGDMTALPERIRAGEVEAPDVFCGGTPCQAFSVAGLRRSLDDARGNLSLTFCEIANAIDDVRQARGDDECIVFWENVPGVLSTKDNAFGCFLAGLAGENEALVAPGGRWSDAGFVDGPQRAVAWRILDAQYFGLAQRRRRLFVCAVGNSRKGFDPAAVLFEWEGVRRDSAPSREAGKRAAVCPTLRAGGNSTGGDRPPGTDVDTADSLQVVQPYTVGNTLTARMHKGINTTLDEGQTPILAHSLRGEGFDASEDGTGRGTPLVPVQTVGSLTAGHGGSAGHQYRQKGNEDALVPVVFHPTQDPISSEDICHAIGTGNGQGCATAAVLAPTLTASNDPSRSPQSSEVTAQVAAVVQATAAVAFKYTMGAKAHGIGYAEEQSPTLDTRPESNAVVRGMQVRRLTPIECERLQGFPDDYTAIPWRKKPASECPDGPRYKALGNSWAVPVVRWIGARIANAVD